MRIWQDDNSVVNDHVRVLAAMVWSFQSQLLQLLNEDAIRNGNYSTQWPSAPERPRSHNPQGMEWRSLFAAEW
jgi:hypothetical protein